GRLRHHAVRRRRGLLAAARRSQHGLESGAPAGPRHLGNPPRPLSLLSGGARQRFFLLLSLVISTTLVALSNFFSPDLPGGISLWHVINSLVSVLSITLVFALIYKVLPDMKIPWSDVWLGSGFTALLFSLGKYLLSLYLGYTSVTSAFGAAGSLVLILFWIYYSAQLFLFGAEFIRAHALSRGAHLVPRSSAVALTCEDRL